MDEQDANQLSDIESYLVNFNREISDELPSSSNTSAFLYATNTILSNGDDVYADLRSSVPSADKHLKSDRNEGRPSRAGPDQASAPPRTVAPVPGRSNRVGDSHYTIVLSEQEDEAGEKGEKSDARSGSNKQNELSIFDFDEEANGLVGPDVSQASDGSREPYEEEEEEEDDEEEDDDDEEDEDDEELELEEEEEENEKSGGEGPGNIFKCNHCDYASSKRFQLSRHLKSHSDERPHKCDYCSLAFKSRVALTNHTNTHRGVRPNKCKECEACFTTTGELIRHVRYRHTYEKPHRCTVCNYASVELSKLRRHVRSHTGERPYQCPHCPYASPDTFKLKRHLRVHTGERPYKCDICDMRFTQSNSLKSHRLIHTGARPIFKCELCPSTCTRKTDLRNHVLRIHTSDKPLLCRKCGKNFPDRYTYRIHSRTHDGQKCFKCELCPYSASVQRHLEHHIMTHTGERPYKCNLCHQAFRQKTLLRKHYTVAHNANSELALKQREKIHVCPHCSRAFANAGSMAKHIKRLHGSEDEDDDDDDDEEEEEEEEEEEVPQEQKCVKRSRRQLEKNGLKEEDKSVQCLQMEADNDDACKVEDNGEGDGGDNEEEEEGEEETKPPPAKKSRLSAPGDRRRMDSTRNSDPGKKRRGRPRKTPNAEKESDDDYVPKTFTGSSLRNGGSTPRRRGRPPKVRLYVAVAVEPEENDEDFDEEDDDDETYNANNSRLIRRKAREGSPPKPGPRDGCYVDEGFVYDEDGEEDDDDDDGEDVAGEDGKVEEETGDLNAEITTPAIKEERAK